MWVGEERSAAIALANNGAPIRIIPLLLEDVKLPTLLVSVSRKAIDMRCANYELGLRQLVAVLKGEETPERTTLEQFAEFVSSLVEVDDQIAETLAGTELFANPRNWADRWFGGAGGGEPEERKRIEADAGMKRATIDESLKRSRLNDMERDRLLAAIDEGLMPPYIKEAERREIREWLRLADEELVSLAAFLYSMRRKENRRDISFDLILQLVAGWSGRGESPQLSEAEIRWKAEQLADRARNRRLLRPSENNQWFRHGPRVMDVGRGAFLHELYDSNSQGRKPLAGRLMGS